jgi:hypothetical protein
MAEPRHQQRSEDDAAWREYQRRRAAEEYGADEW